MTKKRVYSHILLDRSGSMGSGYEHTVEAVNGYIAGLVNDPEISSRVSLTLFDSHGGAKPNAINSPLQIEHIFTGLKPKDAPKVGRHNYQPRGGTPLLDAIGRVVTQIDGQTRRDGEIVTLVVVTDGYENASVEHTRDSIKALLDQRKAKGWLVIYLGADHDAFAQASTMGFDAVNTMAYNKANTGATMAAVTRSTASYVTTGDIRASAFTAEERDKAAGK